VTFEEIRSNQPWRPGNDDAREVRPPEPPRPLEQPREDTNGE
jgi:hypothetical protein